MGGSSTHPNLPEGFNNFRDSPGQDTTINRILDRLVRVIPATIRENYSGLSYPEAEKERIKNCFNSLCLLLDDLDRHSDINTEFDKLSTVNTALVDKVAHLQEDKVELEVKLKSAEEALQQAQDQSAALATRVEVAESEFSTLVKHLPEFGQKILNSNVVTQRFRDLVNAAELVARCEFYDDICQFTDCTTLPSIIADQIISTDEARNIYDQCKGEASTIEFPELQEVCQKEQATAADIIALKL